MKRASFAVVWIILLSSSFLWTQQVPVQEYVLPNGLKVLMVPKKGDPNKFNERLVQEVQRDGRVFLSSTTLGGKFIIRLAVLCFRTHLQIIDLAIHILREKAKYLEENY